MRPASLNTVADTNIAALPNGVSCMWLKTSQVKILICVYRFRYKTIELYMKDGTHFSLHPLIVRRFFFLPQCQSHFKVFH